MTTMPDTIRIGGIDYAFYEIPDLHDNHTPLDGRLLIGQQQIHVEAQLSLGAKWATTWHEAIHGMLDNAGIIEHDESLVQAVAYGVIQLLRDNPWLREQPHVDSSPNNSLQRYGILPLQQLSEHG